VFAAFPAVPARRLCARGASPGPSPEVALAPPGTGPAAVSCRSPPARLRRAATLAPLRRCSGPALLLWEPSHARVFEARSALGPPRALARAPGRVRPPTEAAYAWVWAARTLTHPPTWFQRLSQLAEQSLARPGGWC